MKEKKAKKKLTKGAKILMGIFIPAGALLLAAVLLAGGLYAWMAFGMQLYQRFAKPMDILNDSSSWYFSDNPWWEKLPRQKGWRQIVQNSRFTLGEPQWTATDYKDWVYYELALPDAAFPVIDGSTVMVPMAVEFARQHLGMDAEQAGRFFTFSTTHYAYDHLCTRVTPKSYNFVNYFEGVDYTFWDTGPVELVLGTAPGEEEYAIAAVNNVEFIQKPVCWDAFVFITGKNNPVDSLTFEQVRDIFSGKITNWSELGGPNKAIRAYQREPGSGSQTGIEQLVMRGVPMADPKMVKVIAGMGELVDAVAEYQNSAASIGYSYRYYIDNQYSNENIKILKIEGVAPTDENIVSGAYPLSVNYVGVIRAGEEDGPGGLFLDWILSEEGQACVRQAGYIPVNNANHQ